MELPDIHLNGCPADHVEQSLFDSRPVEISCPAVPSAVSASLSVGHELLGPPTLVLGDGRWRWEWHPRGRVGTFRCRLILEDETGRRVEGEFPVAVVPGKLEQLHYDALIAAIQGVAAGLVYALQGGAAAAVLKTEPGGPASLIEEYWTRLKTEAALAGSVVRALAGSSRSITRQDPANRHLTDLVDIRPQMLARLAERPVDEVDDPVPAPLAGILPRSREGKIRLPRSVPTVVERQEADLYEHRLLSRILLDMRARCLYLEEALARELAWRGGSVFAEVDLGMLPRLREWIAEVGAVRRRVAGYRRSEFLEGIPPAEGWKGTTSLMRNDRRYAAIGRLWHMREARPFVAVDSPAFDLPANDLPLLYEVWCLLEVIRALEPHGLLVRQQLFEQDRGPDEDLRLRPWRLRLSEDVPLIHRRRADGLEIALYYRRRYHPREGQQSRLGSLDPFLRIPDIALELRAPGRRPTVIVFDAKYRVGSSGAIPEDAMADAYSYAGAIGCQASAAATGVFLLFPGTEGFEASRVGALPLLPGHTDALDDLLARYLQSAT